MNGTRHLPLLVTFAHVARLGSFARAADALGVSTSAVSQQVRALEGIVGLRLLERTTRRVGLTEHGRSFLARIGPALQGVDAAFEEMERLRGKPVGTLRINSSLLALQLLVEPLLPAFLACHPDVAVDLFADDTLSDLVEGGFDAGIRLGEKLAQDVVALPIGPPQRVVVVATPALLRRDGVPQRPADLVGRDCLRQRWPGSRRLQAWRFRERGRDVELEVSGRLIVSDFTSTARWALAHPVLAQGFEALLRPALRQGRLVEVLTPFEPPPRQFHLYFPARAQMAPKLRAFVDFVRDVAGAQAANEKRPGAGRAVRAAGAAAPSASSDHHSV